MNGTINETYAKREKEREQIDVKPTTYLIPKKLGMTIVPSVDSNETVPFPTQPELRLYDVFDRWVENVGTIESPWIVTASLVPGFGDSGARLEGTLEVAVVNGTAKFTDLSISHSGSGYKILYNVTYPSTVQFSYIHGAHVIKERQIAFKFAYDFTQVYDAVAFSRPPSVQIYDVASGAVVKTGWKNREWTFEAHLMSASSAPVTAKLFGPSTIEIFEGYSAFLNLSIDAPGTGFQLKFTVKTIPVSSYKTEYVTPKFNVTKRQFSLQISKQVGDCNDTVVCGHQPTIQIRSVLPDRVAENLHLNGKQWFVNVSLCSSSDPMNPLKGTTSLEILSSRETHFTDLYLDYPASNLAICFEVIVQTTSPSDALDDRYRNLTAKSTLFDVAARQMYLFELLAPDKANDSVVFGQQPVIDVRDFGTGKSSFPFRGQWNITASLVSSSNGGQLFGAKTVVVVGTQASFVDLKISSYGVGFVLKFKSSSGHEVCRVLVVLLVAFTKCYEIYKVL